MEYVIEVLQAEKHRLSILREQLILADREGSHYDIAYNKIREIEKTIEKLQALPNLIDNYDPGLCISCKSDGIDYDCECRWWDKEGKRIFKEVN